LVTNVTAAKANVTEVVDELRSELVRVTMDLLRFRTLTRDGTDFRECAEYIAEELEQAGAAAEIIDVPERELRIYGGARSHYRALGLRGEIAPRFNVLGQVAGAGRGKSLHFNGHYDLIDPVDGNWTRDPFDPWINSNDEIVGRGAVDMKGGVAATIIALRALREAGVRPAADIFASATIDTHFGGLLGAGYLAKRGLGRADRVIVTDHSGPHRILLGYRGELWCEIRIRGRLAHASIPSYGVDPVAPAMAVVEALYRLGEQLGTVTSQWPIVPAVARHPNLVVASIATEPYTIHEVPESATIAIDRRLIPEETVDDAEEQIRAIVTDVARRYPDAEFEFTKWLGIPGTATDEKDELVQVLAANIKKVTGRAPEMLLHAVFFDLHWFTKTWQVPGVTYGPGDGGAASEFRVKRYYQPDEGIAIDDLVSAAKVLALSAQELTA
jgi:succinyl-diaminopimelate desuccinylase